MPRILVLYYSMYGHVKKLADQIAEGVRQEGCEVVVYQAPETLSEDVLKLLKAPPKPSDPVFTFDKHSVLAEADGVLFGFPTRFGMMCAQMKAVFDSFGRKCCHKPCLTYLKSSIRSMAEWSFSHQTGRPLFFNWFARRRSRNNCFHHSYSASPLGNGICTAWYVRL